MSVCRTTRKYIPKPPYAINKNATTHMRAAWRRYALLSVFILLHDQPSPMGNSRHEQGLCTCSSRRDKRWFACRERGHIPPTITTLSRVEKFVKRRAPSGPAPEAGGQGRSGEASRRFHFFHFPLDRFSQERYNLVINYTDIMERDTSYGCSTATRGRKARTLGTDR
jgi:hypothetical protein